MPKTRHAVFALALLAGCLAGGDGLRADEGTLEAARERLRHRLEAAAGPAEIVVTGQVVHCESSLRRFYERRNFAPAWTADGWLSDQALALVASIETADAYGLNPGDYHLRPLRRACDPEAGGDDDATRDPPHLVDAELLLTDAWLLLATHYLAGKLDPATLDPEWVANRRQADLAATLEAALQDRAAVPSLLDLLPRQEGYALLQAGLARYRAIAADGGWPDVPAGPLLKPGARDPRLGRLAARLAAEGPVIAATEHYGPELETAVRDFQRRCGLHEDGIVGPATVAALNIGAAARADQIRVNLERWRWLPQDLGRRHLVVNVADFHLDLVEGDSTILSLPVIVGRPYRRTPVFSAPMTYLVFSPAWEVPPRLAVQDKLPLIRRDPGYLAAQGFEVLRGWGAEERVVDPDTVRWQELGPGRFPYRLRQKPGPLNALGEVKFMFPNRFDVYLHDTPARELFTQTVRTFSSGCIRVGHAERLAVALLAGDPTWGPEAVTAALTAGSERTVALREPVPVHLQYWTAWADREGIVQFRDDIYDRDGAVLAALAEPPPADGL